MYRSTKFLIFVVNDMLDLGQLNSSKFRKQITKFNILESVKEIIGIQDYKVKQMEVAVDLNLHNF